jgi:dolichyl-phosphate beta-glucosyltransferase
MELKLSIVIPVYNEEKRIRNTLNELFFYLQKTNLVPTEIIAVNDGSSDNTLEILKEYQDRINIISYSPNMGKGFAVKQGVLRAHGQYILFMDADLATSLNEISHILSYAGEFDVVIGSRKINKQQVERTFVRQLGGSAFSLATKMVLPLGVKDSQCGFKMFNSEAAREIFNRARINRWAFDVEILYLARRLQYSMKEIPVVWQEKGDSKVKISGAIRMLKEVFSVRLNSIAGIYNAKIPQFQLEYFQEELPHEIFK